MNDVIKSEALPLAMTAQVNTQVATAKQYPRNIKQIIATVTDYVTMDLETAASCTYSKPQGGKFIEGESIRLAEIMAAEWGNLAIEVGLVRDTIHLRRRTGHQMRLELGAIVQPTL